MMIKRPVINNPKFLQLLKARQLIPDNFIDDLLVELQGNVLDVLATLIQSGVGTKRLLCQLWCDSIGIAHVDLEKTLFQSHIVKLMPERLARQFFAIPVYQMGDTVTVATPTPDNATIREEIRKIIGGPINLVFALPQDIEWAIDTEYKSSMDVQEFFSKIKISGIFQSAAPITEEKLTEIAGKDAANQLHVALILYSITENASEILIEPEENSAKIHFIINGSVRRISTDKWAYGQLQQKLKQMAAVDESNPENESRSARILFPTPGKKIDIQFLSLPTDFGDKIFLKILDRSPLPRVPSLSELYLSKTGAILLREFLKAPQGLFLVTGTAESGKTTTSYSMLHALKSASFKCVTIEDGIKNLIAGIHQYQVNPRSEFNRGELIDACLKMQPDVIYIQNVDDPLIKEAIIGAVEAHNIAIIGSMEATRVDDALEKAIGMGLDPILTGIFSQHLVPRLCDHCKESYRLLSTEIQKNFIWDGKAEISACREKGCTYCRQSGFAGRIGVQEIVMIDATIRNLLNGHTPLTDIFQAIKQRGYKSREYDGIKKVLRGLTAMTEIEKMRKSA
jgi:type IV pilus assembly protein PilB